MARRSMALWAGTMLLSLPALAEPFSYLPPGDLLPNTGMGKADLTVYAPNMRFPLEEAAAHLNSQVYGRGGVFGPGGRECDLPNFSYPWRDTFCETRSNPQEARACPKVKPVHQGVDIRAKTCEKNKHWVVAVEDGIVAKIGSYSLYLIGSETGIKYTYLHMAPESLQVSVGNQVTKGQRLGRVSNVMPPDHTTTHLHFEIQLPIANGYYSFVPPYMSLVAAYQRLLAESGVDSTPPTGSTVVADTSAPPTPPIPPAPTPQRQNPKNEPTPFVFSTNRDIPIE